jgi:hypothetical protein
MKYFYWSEAMQSKKWMASGAVVATLLAGLTGCGGSVDAEVDDVAVPELPQGIWRGTVGTDTVSVIVLPAASPSAGELWSIGRDSLGGTRLLKADVALDGGTFVGTGSLLSSSPTSITPNVSVSAAGAGDPLSSLSFTLGSDSSNLSFAGYYADSATLSDWTGQWQNSQTLGSAGTLLTTWTVSAEGAISGTRSDGCSYQGSVALRPEAKAVVDIEVEETCASTTVDFRSIGSPGVNGEGNVVGRIVTLLRTDGQSFSLLLFSPATPP